MLDDDEACSLYLRLCADETIGPGWLSFFFSFLFKA
jgi:hypothetical protein